MSSSTADAIGRPLTVKEITTQAEAFEINTRIPLKAWIRTANTLLNEADIYLREANFAKAYLLLWRYSYLVTHCIAQHPEFKTQPGRQTARPSINKMNTVVSNLEKIKPFVEGEHRRWQQQDAARKAAHEETQAQLQSQPQSQVHELEQENDLRRRTSFSSKAPAAYAKYASRDPALSSRATLLEAGEHQELAVDLAQREIRRRDADRKATRKAGISPEEEHTRRIAGFWENWTADLADRQADDEDSFRMQMESTRRQLEGEGDGYGDGDAGSKDPPRRHVVPPAPLKERSHHYRYPSIAKSEPVQFETASPRIPRDVASRPQRPLKEPLPEPLRPSLPPKIPTKDHLYSTQPAGAPDSGAPVGVPPPPPKVLDGAPQPKPAEKERVTFKPAAYLENGEPLRTVFLPSQLRHDFVSLASENTKRGIEMCGLLCGTMVNNALFVSCLLIPEQICTPDTCETENEGSISEFCIEQDLIQFGWIHTHPTQTCFMSSRDLHTHASYQVSLPESIAIVCSPRFEPTYGIFRLTDPPGQNHILDCTQTNTFHPHSVENLYTDAGNPPGHVFQSSKLEYQVKDLRPRGPNGAAAVPRKTF